jgi:hypothetical protein
MNNHPMKKTNSKQFQKKLKSFSAMASTIIAAVNTGNAQVVYTDIVPDSTVNTNGGEYNLDLNNDGTFDFKFNVTLNPGGSASAAYTKVGVTPLNSNGIAGSTAGAYVYPFAMNNGDSINASLSFNMGSNQSMGSYWGASYTYGNWTGVNDKYIGLKLDVAGVTRYGWARLDVDAHGTTFTIKDYAYETMPDTGIPAGATVTGIHENQNQADDISVYSSEKTIIINQQNNLSGLVIVTNSLGQEISRTSVAGTQTKISLENAAPGIYFVTVTKESTRITKKVFIK